MKKLTVACFGHRLLDQPIQIERMMEKYVYHLLRQHEFVEFLIGRDGEFDLLAASVIRRCKRSLGNHTNGGAYQAMRYAQQQNKPTVNLFDFTSV